MLISTGLLPVVKNHKVLKTTTNIALGHISGTFPLPKVTQDQGEVWVVELVTVKDSKEAPQGTIQDVLILSKQPVVSRRWVKLSIPSEERGDFAARQYEHARKEHHIPDDAVIEEHWLGAFHMKEQVISWYELGV